MKHRAPLVRSALTSCALLAGLRLDVIRQAFEPPKTVSAENQGAAMVMAAWSGQREVIALVLESGVDRGVRPGPLRGPPSRGGSGWNVGSEA